MRAPLPSVLWPDFAPLPGILGLAVAADFRPLPAGGAALILWTGWVWLDPVMSLVICAVILWSTWGLLRSSVDMSLSAVPEGVHLSKVCGFLFDRPGVTQIHDLHIWPISTTETAMTCHLVMPGGHPGDDFLMECCRQLLKKSHKIGHATLQIEVSEGNACALAPDRVVRLS